MAYRTNDYGYITNDLSLILLGRNDQIIKIGGRKVSVLEIENTIIKNNYALDCIVFAIKTKETYQIVASVIEAGDNVIDIVDWRKKLSNHLPTYMLPTKIISLKQYPLLPSGKIDRIKLKKMVLQEQEEKQPLTQIQKELLNCWKELVDDNSILANEEIYLFELGGSSIDVANFIIWVEEQYGFELSFDAFYNKTLSELALMIEKEGM